MKTDAMPVITLVGTPFERGKIYGEKAKSNIAHIVEGWFEDLGSFGQDSRTFKMLDKDNYLKAFFSETRYINQIEKWTPDFLEEIRGIAQGAEQPFEYILGLQLMDEEWIFGLRRGLERPTTKCTAFGLPVTSDGNSYAGQNMDIGSWVDGRQALLRIMPHQTMDHHGTVYEAPESLVFTVTGCLGLNGLNANGLGITCNTVAQLNSSVSGLPVIFIVRAILEKRSLDEAEDFLRSIPHASGQNYILSSQGDMRCFECCGSSVVRYSPEHYQGNVFHTNHPLASKDITSPPLVSSPVENSVARLQSICSRLGEASSSTTLQDAMAALASHDDPANPVSRNVNNEGSSIGYTAGSAIYELGDRPRLHLAAGPPCETDFMVFDFVTQ